MQWRWIWTAMLARFEPVSDVSAREVHKCSGTKMSDSCTLTMKKFLLKPHIPPSHHPTYWFFSLFSRFNQKYEYKCVNFKSTTYPFISFRRKGNGDSNSFWPREINLQSASTEIIDEKYLKPVFAAVGGHAHSPEGVDETHSICVPYIGGAPSHYIKYSFLLIVLACGIFLI